MGVRASYRGKNVLNKKRSDIVSSPFLALGFVWNRSGGEGRRRRMGSRRRRRRQL